MFTSRKTIVNGLLSATLLAALALPLAVQAIVPPEVFNERAAKSKIKAVGEVTDVKALGETDGIERLIVTFKLEKRFSEDQVPEEFIGSCQAIKSGKPKIGEVLYFSPAKGQRYYVTIGEKDNEITSLTPMTPRLMNALTKTPEKVKFRIGAAFVDDGADQYVEKANEALNKKDYRQAVLEANKAIQIAPSFETAFLVRGKVFMEIEKYDSAEQDFDKAIALNPLVLDSYYQRGICKTNQRRYAAAIEDFSKVVDADPKDLQALYCRAAAYKYSNQLDKALADFKKILQSDKDNHIVSRQVAFCAYEKADLPAAEAQFARTLEIAPTDLYSAIFLHIVRGKMKKPSSVQKDAETMKAIESWPAPVLKMFADKISPAQCVEAATSAKPDEKWQLAGAYFYAGEKALLDGDSASAAAYFKKCVDAKDLMSLEYVFAKKELEALKRQAPAAQAQ